MQRRLQVLLDEDRHQRLEALAAERGVSVASVVRDAIDRGLAAPDARRRAAAAAILAAPAGPTPDPEALVEELRELRGRRG